MIKRLFSYAGEYKKYVFLAPLFVILETAGELALPLLIAKIIDDGIMVGNLPMIYRIGVYMVIMAIAAVFLGAFGAKFGSYGSIGIGANLRQAEFRNISRFSFADIDYFSSASLVTRLTNDVTNVQNFVMMMIRMLWRTLSQIVVSLVVLFTMQWKLALILVASIPVIGVAIAILMTKCHPLFELMQQKIDELNEKVQENLVGIRVVKAFVREDYEEEKFQQANDAFTHAGLKAVLTIVLQQPIMMMGITIVTASGAVLRRPDGAGRHAGCRHPVLHRHLYLQHSDLHYDDRHGAAPVRPRQRLCRAYLRGHRQGALHRGRRGRRQ